MVLEGCYYVFEGTDYLKYFFFAYILDLEVVPLYILLSVIGI
jgi:hypothetical protein